MTLFADDPYGGIAPWAETSMLLGSGLLRAGAPGGGGLSGLMDVGSQLAQAGSRRAQRRYMAEAAKRAQTAEERQQAMFDYQMRKDLEGRQASWRIAKAMGLPVGSMPTMSTITGAAEAMPPGGPLREGASAQTGLIPEESTLFSGMPQGVSALMGEMVLQGKAPEAVRLMEQMKPPAPKKWEMELEALRDQYTEDQINEMIAKRFRYQPAIDPLTGQPVFRDLLTMGETAAPPTEPSPEAAPIPEAAPAETQRLGGMPEIPGGYERGTGGSAFFANIGNTLADAVGLPLMAPEAQRAITALDTLNTRTMLELSSGIPGRPSNLTREALAGLGPRTANLLQGDEAQKIRVEETLALLDSQTDNWQQVANDPTVPVDQRQAATDKVNNIAQLKDAYTQVLRNFEGETENPYEDYTIDQLNEAAKDTSKLSNDELRYMADRYDELMGN